MNSWYPAKLSHDSTDLSIENYFDFPAVENTENFFSKLKAYQYKHAKQYAIDGNMDEDVFTGDTADYAAAKATAFDHYLSLKTWSHKDAQPEDGEYPLVIYHQGLGGTMDENNVLLEYLASHGYIVVSSAFEQSDGSGYAEGWNVGVGDLKASLADIQFIINNCKHHYRLKSNNVFLMGHSYGANTTLSFLGEGQQNVTGIVPLDSDFGYVLNSFFPDKYNSFSKDKLKYVNVPIFCVGRQEAHFRMIDSLTLSTRYYLTIEGMKHNDFTSQGAVGRYHCLPYVKTQEQYQQVTTNYLHMCTAVLQFLNSYADSEKGIDKKDIHLSSGWNFAISRPGGKLPQNMPFVATGNNCPSPSQFLDLIYNKGLSSAENIYAQCSDSLFTNSDNLLEILDALFTDTNADTLIAYINWMNALQIAEGNLEDIFDIVFYNAFYDRGNGYHYEKADSIYQWMIHTFPRSKYGYMGRLLMDVGLDKTNREMYCKKLLRIEPTLATADPTSDYVRRIKDSLQHYLSKE